LTDLIDPLVLNQRDGRKSPAEGKETHFGKRYGELEKKCIPPIANGKKRDNAEGQQTKEKIIPPSR
jgi:hypothetical protein